MNLPERKVLTKIVTWLAPGGWLVTEELDHLPGFLTMPGAAVSRWLVCSPVAVTALAGPTVTGPRRGQFSSRAVEDGRTVGVWWSIGHGGIKRSGHRSWSMCSLKSHATGPQMSGLLWFSKVLAGAAFRFSGMAKTPLAFANSPVKTLTGGCRSPFGVASPELTIAEEILQPGDWLVFYTDGITEARNHDGERFGHTRLVDFPEREAAAAHPPPETVRRLTHAVMTHQRAYCKTTPPSRSSTGHPEPSATTSTTPCFKSLSRELDGALATKSPFGGEASTNTWPQRDQSRSGPADRDDASDHLRSPATRRGARHGGVRIALATEPPASSATCPRPMASASTSASKSAAVPVVVDTLPLGSSSSVTPASSGWLIDSAASEAPIGSGWMSGCSSANRSLSGRG